MARRGSQGVEIIVRRAGDPVVEALEVEMAERKGLGHPDSICDAIAEEFSQALCRYYLKQFGRILHHNVDKVLLRGGSARAVFGGGEVLAPIELYLAGRATSDVGGIGVPVADLAVESTRTWFSRYLHALDPQRHIEIHCLVRPGSADLQALFARRSGDEIPLANDSVIGVGFAPLNDLERAIIATEQHLNSAEVKARCPEIGEDIKILGIRRGATVRLTVACAFVARHVPSLGQYLERREHVRRLAAEAARRAAGVTKVETEVNTADDPAAGSVYLTVTGTSAEGGDDGHTGRGNRISGLITPYRPMSLESLAGKNPLTHPGKLYQIAAQHIAAALPEEITEVEAAECYLAGAIGRPITEPEVVDVQVRWRKRSRPAGIESRIRQIVRREIERLPGLWRGIVRGATDALT
jgi:S-adenosylmethionine synthetase